MNHSPFIAPDIKPSSCPRISPNAGDEPIADPLYIIAISLELVGQQFFLLPDSRDEQGRQKRVKTFVLSFRIRSGQ